MPFLQEYKDSPPHPHEGPPVFHASTQLAQLVYEEQGGVGVGVFVGVGVRVGVGVFVGVGVRVGVGGGTVGVGVGLEQQRNSYAEPTGRDSQ